MEPIQLGIHVVQSVIALIILGCSIYGLTIASTTTGFGLAIFTVSVFICCGHENLHLRTQCKANIRCVILTGYLGHCNNPSCHLHSYRIVHCQKHFQILASRRSELRHGDLLDCDSRYISIPATLESSMSIQPWALL